MILSTIFGAPAAIAAPACGSDAGDFYIDAQKEAGETASDAGRHRESLRIWESLAAYHQRCVEPTVSAYQRNAGQAVVNMSSEIRTMAYTRAITAYIKAAHEAQFLGESAKRCSYARLAQRDEHVAFPQDHPDKELTPLLRGCR